MSFLQRLFSGSSKWTFKMYYFRKWKLIFKLWSQRFSYMEINENPKTQKTQKDYCCEMCNYNTRHKNDYSKHLTTDKHKNVCLGNKMDIPGNQKTQKNPILFMCSNCNKNYNTNSGLWKHKKGCNNLEEIQNEYVDSIKLQLSDLENVGGCYNEVKP